jgi:hypothetical protein
MRRARSIYYVSHAQSAIADAPATAVGCLPFVTCLTQTTMNETPNELLEIESQLRSLRANAPQVVVLRASVPPCEKTSRYYVAGLCLLLGLVIGGVTVDRIRPVPPPVEIVRIVEVPVQVEQPQARVAAKTQADSESFGTVESLNLDTMLDQYHRRAQLFAKADWVAAIPRPSYGSIADPMSVVRLRKTLDL